LFINVTKTELKNDKLMVTELDQLISDEYGSGFYDSCKDVKFGATNGNAMSFIGGGAKNYPEFLKFLGDKKPFGSPFQINFPDPKKYKEPAIEPLPMVPKKCNDEDESFRCACLDCPAVCPTLPAVSETGSCHVGILPCLSFGAILVYGIIVGLLGTAIIGHIAVAKVRKAKSERMRLIQDTTMSDDEDEGEMIHNNAMYDRPLKNYWINTICDTAFSRLGFTAARFPAITIATCVFLVGILSIGWIRFSIETNPARLWVSPTSAAAKEKAFFDENFGPFYRTEQVFLVNDTVTKNVVSPVMSYETLLWWKGVEDRVAGLKGNKTGTSFDDICLKPTGDACVVQSVTAYFDSSPSDLSQSNWRKHIRECVETNVNCLPKFSQPVDPKLVIGGNGNSTDPTNAPAIITTWVVNNGAEDSSFVKNASDWEQALKMTLLDVQTEAAARGLRLSFNTEISLEEELNKSTNTDAKIVVISYIIMFFYASLALGSTTLSLHSVLRNPATFLVESKFSLGVVGILIVLMSISASIGLFSFAGVKVTLIIAEVIPFIVLAVGVDNIFLIVHEFERVNISHPDDVVEHRIAKALGRMGPSILLSAITETIAFALGAFVGMPAVRNFAIYAAGAVFINAVLQVTMFVSVLSLNQRRAEDQRVDCVPCIQVKSAGIQLGVSSGNGYNRPYEGQDEGTLQTFIRKRYAPALLGRKMKVAVVVVFLGIFTAAISLMPEVALGLDQRVAIPDGSYLIPYFNDLYSYFESGPPVYFVTRDVNATERAHQRQLCARFTTCEQESLTNILEQERKRPDTSYIASTAASWVDDYLRWLDPDLEQCCVEKEKNDRGRVEERTCFANRVPAWNITLSGMPEGEEFVYYLQKWLEAPTGEDCPLGGKATYGSALVVDEKKTTIPASHFRSSHTPLRSQDDFIKAYASARRISSDLTEKTGIEVFPYSIFYIYFDQYAGIVKLTATLLGSALAIILAISSILLGSVLTGGVVTITVIMIVVDIIGFMAVFDVSLNAVSLVNLIICVGIGVEFCAHIARAFMFPSRAVMERAKNKFRGRDARAWTALVNVGGSVFSGITITKLLGVFVLAFTRSKIFEIYYFRIWLALVIFAATHALIFLPVALSLLGGEGYVDPESDGGLEEDLASRRYRALLPDEEDSEDEY
jgi:Niemann-Pick C1 protein